MRRGALLLALALAQLLAVACHRAGPRDPTTVRRGPALTPGPARPDPGGLRILHLADFGDNTEQQAGVAAAAAAAQRRAPFRLAFFPGDNLYECGPDAARPGAEACAFAADGNTAAAPPLGTDPGFARRHEAPLAALLGSAAPPRLYLALGNHDVATWGGCVTLGLAVDEAARRKACAEVAHASAAWSMPGRHYVVDEGPARFIVLDSNLVDGDYGGFTLEAEVGFLTAAAAPCAARPCFLVAHHPPATAGEHAADLGPAQQARFARLLQAAGPVRAWLAGHDHDLQHLRGPGGLDVLISGNGSRARPAERFERVGGGGELLFASTSPGLGILVIGDAGWSYRFEDAAGHPLHCCAAAARGPCDPVGCNP